MKKPGIEELANLNRLYRGMDVPAIIRHAYSLVSDDPYPLKVLALESGKSGKVPAAVMEAGLAHRISIAFLVAGEYGPETYQMVDRLRSQHTVLWIRYDGLPSHLKAVEGSGYEQSRQRKAILTEVMFKELHPSIVLLGNMYEPNKGRTDNDFAQFDDAHGVLRVHPFWGYTKDALEQFLLRHNLHANGNHVEPARREGESCPLQVMKPYMGSYI